MMKTAETNMDKEARTNSKVEAKPTVSKGLTELFISESKYSTQSAFE